MLQYTIYKLDPLSLAVTGTMHSDFRNGVQIPGYMHTVDNYATDMEWIAKVGDLIPTVFRSRQEAVHYLSSCGCKILHIWPGGVEEWRNGAKLVPLKDAGKSGCRYVWSNDKEVLSNTKLEDIKLRLEARGVKEEPIDTQDPSKEWQVAHIAEPWKTYSSRHEALESLPEDVEFSYRIGPAPDNTDYRERWGNYLVRQVRKELPWVVTVSKGGKVFQSHTVSPHAGGFSLLFP